MLSLKWGEGEQRAGAGRKEGGTLREAGLPRFREAGEILKNRQLFVVFCKEGGINKEGAGARS